jgi:hypothetical protein
MSETETVRLHRFWAKQNSACELTGTKCANEKQKVEINRAFTTMINRTDGHLSFLLSTFCF